MMLPDRSQVTMDRAFLKSYVELLIQTCHKRGIHAMGGMAAQIPIKNDPAANDAALERVRQDKLREVKAGHDGTWLAHPGLIPIAKAVFDEYMATPNQIHVKREDVHVVAADLLKVHDGQITEQGLRLNVDVGIQYIESWLRGNGCVPIYNLMEDAATAEISRTQVWQWLRHGAQLNDGRKITAEMVREIVASMLQRPGWDGGQFPRAAELFEQLSLSSELKEFLTLEAYRYPVGHVSLSSEANSRTSPGSVLLWQRKSEILVVTEEGIYIVSLGQYVTTPSRLSWQSEEMRRGLLLHVPETGARVLPQGDADPNNIGEVCNTSAGFVTQMSHSVTQSSVGCR